MALALKNTVIVNATTAFYGTGTIQTFTVPVGITHIRFFLWSAGALAQNGCPYTYGGGTPGGGAYMEGNLVTTPGTVYSIIVGGVGGSTAGDAVLAWGGARSSYHYGGGSGGFSGIFSGSPAVATVIAIAGGAGGSGTNSTNNGGGGGYPAGLNGIGPSGTGYGGTQTTGSAQFIGGKGPDANTDGGYGGGGWYGGMYAPGNNGGGGGGSSTYIASVLNPISVNGFTGNLPASAVTPAANESSPYWKSPYGRSGQNGYVVIGWDTREFVPPTASLIQSISGLQLWLDASDTGTFTLNGSSVTAITDKTSTNTFTPSSVTYNSVLKGFVFTRGSSTSISTTYSSCLTTETFFLVISVSSTDNTNVFLQAPTHNRQLYIYSNHFELSARQIGYILATGNLNWSLNTLYLVSFQYNASTSTVYQFGNVIGTGGGSSFTTAGGTTTFGDGGLDGTIYEYLGFPNVVLSDADRVKVEGYLVWKWRLSAASLPTGHPYRIVPYVGPSPQLSFKVLPITYDPTSIGGLQLWLDASDSSTFQLSGSNVTSWADKSSNHFSATGLSNTGVFSSNGFNSLPTVLITTSNTMTVNVSAGTFPTGMTFFVMFRGSRSTSWNCILSRCSAGGVTAPFGYLDQSDGKSSFNIGNGTTEGNSYGGMPEIAIIGSPSLWSCTITPGGTNVWANYVNGTFYMNVNVGATYGDTATSLTIGRWNNATMVGAISEIIFYNRIFSVAERQRIEGYLMWKWNLGASLPTNNVYRYMRYYPYMNIPQQIVPQIRYQFSSGMAFPFTGADQSFVVPTGVTSIFLKMWGAGGYGGSAGGGGGAYVQGRLAVIPGETLTLIVGQGGPSTLIVSYGGGGNYGGGGRTAIRRGATELVTAGGGGAGNGGGAATVDSQSFGGDIDVGVQIQTYNSVNYTGGGGSLTRGGQNVPYPNNSGVAGQYNGGGDRSGSLAGGGGGWWGGGGGGGEGVGRNAGAGSSYLTNLTETINSSSAKRSTPGNASSPLRGTAGRGGINGGGGNGLLYIYWNNS